MDLIIKPNSRFTLTINVISITGIGLPDGTLLDADWFYSDKKNGVFDCLPVSKQKSTFNNSNFTIKVKVRGEGESAKFTPIKFGIKVHIFIL